MEREPATEPALAEFVEQSNALEGFLPSVFGRTSGHPIFVRHLAIASHIASGAHYTPLGLHLALFDGLMAPGLTAGQYRAGPTSVGGEIMPGAKAIASSMAAWETAAAADPGSDPAAWAWHLHNWLVCIHPFPDGNGRVGRLVLNQARRDAGLEWLLIAAEEGLDYAARIRSWRDREGAHLMRQPDGGPCQ